jgi:hypothetical protein
MSHGYRLMAACLAKLFFSDPAGREVMADKFALETITAKDCKHVLGSLPRFDPTVQRFMQGLKMVCNP